MWDVAVGGPGLVAVGWSEDLFLEGLDPVWTSPDGLTWSPAPNISGTGPRR